MKMIRKGLLNSLVDHGIIIQTFALGKILDCLGAVLGEQKIMCELLMIPFIYIK